MIVDKLSLIKLVIMSLVPGNYGLNGAIFQTETS